MGTNKTLTNGLAVLQLLAQGLILSQQGAQLIMAARGRDLTDDEARSVIDGMDRVDAESDKRAEDARRRLDEAETD